MLLPVNEMLEIDPEEVTGRVTDSFGNLLQGVQIEMLPVVVL
jgi:hypothetical protein